MMNGPLNRIDAQDRCEVVHYLQIAIYIAIKRVIEVIQIQFILTITCHLKHRLPVISPIKTLHLVVWYAS